jgi:SH3 domain-containing YSC84-like protein 1
VKIKMTVVTMLLALAVPAFAQQKEAERLNNSARVFKEIVSDNKGLPTSILDKAECVLIFPSVKKIAVGIGGSYGRGVLVCRTGPNMDGGWGPPAMYKLDEGSLGIQLGSTATDFVLLVMNQKGASQILNGKTKLGANAAAAAGPTGTDAQGYNAQAMKVDVLTYSRSKGLFAGVSLTGASMDGDEDANKALYGKPITPSQIINGGTTPDSAKALIATLDSASSARHS